MSEAIYSSAKGGLYGGSFDSSGLDANTRAVMMDERWTTTYGGSEAASVITYAFPTLVTDYTNAPDGYPTSADPSEPTDDDDDENPLDTFAPATELQKAAAVVAMGLVASYTKLTFVEAASPSGADATFRFAAYGDGGSESRFPPNNNMAYSPSDSRSAGDTWLGGNGTPPTAAFFGTDHLNTIMHEMGHALGLKHGHDAGFGRTLTADRNDNEFSVMTYASYMGADADSGASEAWVGSAPQSYMMYDIAALQAYYGANFDRVGTEAVYTWDEVTGQQYINGIPAAFTGASETGKILSTVWTQGADATYDLSNFNEDQLADLRPGQWLRFSASQIADLNNEAPEGTVEYQAQGNIYNALLYQGDARSLVANLITGSGNDLLIGNDADNGLSAGAGDDTIDGGLGDDTISGGAGADSITFGAGRNLLRDLLSDLDGDSVLDFTTGNAVQILGTHVSRADFTVTNGPGLATIGLQDSAFTLHGDFGGGDFIAAARGSGEDGFTHLAFIPYLPDLAEHVTVDAAAINGIADSILLAGDGMVSFTVTLEAATSSYRNMVGSYRIAADGTITDVGLLFSDVLAESAASSSVALGTPGAGESIGFFLVQDGAALYESLPDDLSFRATGGETPWVLHSASLGDLTSAAVFHSVAGYNPGGSVQVLSGLQSGDQDLWIGFEDLIGDLSDNDFQDVVLTIREMDSLIG
jgi:serralysin